MPQIEITVCGNLARDPDVKFTPNGVAVAQFTVASNERVRDGDGWKDGPTSWVRCVAWRDLAEHVADSLNKGDRVVVRGVLRQREYEAPAKNGDPGGKRSVWEVQADDVGPNLKYASAKIKKASRDQVPPPEDPWADSVQSGGPGGYSDEAPF